MEVVAYHTSGRRNHLLYQLPVKGVAIAQGVGVGGSRRLDGGSDVLCIGDPRGGAPRHRGAPEAEGRLQEPPGVAAEVLAEELGRLAGEEPPFGAAPPPALVGAVGADGRREVALLQELTSGGRRPYNHQLLQEGGALATKSSFRRTVPLHPRDIFY